jgi:hypothetical protein
MLWRVMDEGPNGPALSAVRKYAAKGINRKMILCKMRLISELQRLLAHNDTIPPV